MHTKEEVGLFLLARGDGMSVRDAAAFAGVGMGSAKRRSAGRLPRSYTGRPWGSGRIEGDDARTTRGGARVGKIKIKGPYEPPETGPLAEMTPDQIEKPLLRAASAWGNSCPSSTPGCAGSAPGASRGHLAGGRPTRPPCAGLRGVGLSKKISASPSAMNALHVRSVPLPRGPNDASAPLSATLPIRLARATWARVCVAHADLASVRRVKHLATRQALHVLSS